MSLQEKFNRHLKQFPFIQRGQKQLLAVSGGIDSVVLCELMFRAGYDFVIAHCNFQLRQAESDRDERFVRELAGRCQKEVLVEKFETEQYAIENRVSIQVAARELRYKWFNDIVNGGLLVKSTTPNSINAGPLQYIITAHHASDNIETLLMNFFKGTGISGLHGILPLQGKIFRPLLFAKKDELLHYARELQLEFVEDSSNLSDKYTRNFFRHRLFPMLKEVYPAVEENLLNNIQRFSEAEELYKQSVEQHKKKLLEVKGNEVHIPVLKLQKSTPVSTLVFEIIKEFGYTANQVKDVMRLMQSESSKYVASDTHRIIRNRKWLIISPRQTDQASNMLIQSADEEVQIDGGKLFFEVVHNAANQIPTSADIAALDLAEISFPLLLRKWKQGDYFYPLGMKKKKKLSRFFVDHKLSKTEKEQAWVLEMNKKIIWIVGRRIDDRFKVLPTTKSILKITFQPS